MQITSYQRHFTAIFLLFFLLPSGIFASGSSDTTVVPVNDTVDQQIAERGDAKERVLTSKVEYNATDSITFALEDQKVFLYGSGYVKYEDIEMRAGYIEIDFSKDELFAKGSIDSAGIETGRPEFTEGDETFRAETIRYNFRTKKGHISGVITEQEGGFLHGETTKKQENNHIHIQRGKFTTCEEDDPHFHISMSRAKVIPDDKIISGPLYLVIEDIPLPLGLPFGYFPNTSGRTSGVIAPSYGEERSRGFYLSGGGYYFAISEYMDLSVKGDIYTLGSWAAEAQSNYRKRYSYNGSFRLAFSRNVAGQEGLPGYQENESYKIAWQHRQDAKASPNSSFSASVNFGSSSYNRFNEVDPDRHATNTAQSSVSYSYNWPDLPFSLRANARINQNFSQETVDMSLPTMTFNMARQYPFRSDASVGDSRWYENIQVSYSAKIDNRINTTESMLFKPATLQEMRNGFQHDMPVSANFRMLNIINITPSVTYSGVMFPNSIRKRWVEDIYDEEADEFVSKVVTDTIPGLVYGHAINPSFSMSLSQDIFGMFQFSNSRIEAIRHVMTPSVSFSFTPDMEGLLPDYYRTVQTDEEGNESTYSIFDHAIYSTPSIRGRAGNISFRLSNNLEMKARNSAGEEKKIKILDRLNFQTGYNIYADSLNLNNIGITGSTSFMDNDIRVNFGATIDPYAIDQEGRRYNRFEWNENNRPGRVTRASLSLDMRFRSEAGQGPGPQDRADPSDIAASDEIFGHLDEIDHRAHYYPDYVDFDVPWNINIRYSLNYSKPRFDSQINQTLNFSGDLSLTPKWKIQFSSGWDFDAMAFTMTNIRVYRDLHCWEMRFGVVPFGARKSWNFTIQVKSQILQDLRYQAQKSWYDNFFR